MSLRPRRSSERILSSLLQQGLIVDLGRKDSPGRPIMYGTSAYFLECIGMDSLEELAGHVPPELTAPAGEDIQEDIDGKATEGNE